MSVSDIVAIANWINNNSGLVSVLIFLLGLLIAWASGIFAALRRKPKLSVELIDGPTFSCTFKTGAKHDGFDVHRTAFALYLKIANVGSASTSIKNICLGYHWHLRPFSWDWLRYRVFWFWLDHPTIALNDFQVEIGENIKFYPSLFQSNAILGTKPETFLEVGFITNGVIYFEQRESWGGCFPLPRNGKTRIIVAVIDAFNTSHKKHFWLPIVSLEEAKKFNPSFGDSLPALHGQAN